MLALLKRMFSEGPAAPDAQLPEGRRVYAVGDIHGRRDLFDALIGAIEDDDREAGSAETTVILLGDLVDRGRDSAGVIERARAWQRRREVRILAGNHEEMFLRSFDQIDMLRHYLRHGGRETVLSFGIEPDAFTRASLDEVQRMMEEVVPQEVREYLASFEERIAIGDYLFVHAGIDPRVPLEEQKGEDLRWIREPFLSHSDPHEYVVVHGHTISRDPEDRGNRIGIDTGAYASGRLTALVLEGGDRRYLEAVEMEDGRLAAGPRLENS